MRDRAVLTFARAVPGFAVRVALAAEQDRLAVTPARDQHQHRLRLLEPAQVPEIRILAVRIERVVAAHALGRGRQYQNGIVTGCFHQLPATTRVLGGGDPGKTLHAVPQLRL
ncbi:hypothetical protein D3C71_1232830 [compost metagenome]